MAIGALLNQLTGKLVGPDKATIMLFQYEDSNSSTGISKTESTGKIKVESAVPVGGGAAKGTTSSSSLGGGTSAASTSLKAASSVTSSVTMPSIPDPGAGENESSVSNGPSGTEGGLSYTSKLYTVAFNPESLTVATEGGGLREVKNFGAAASGTAQTGATEAIDYVTNERRNMTMSVDLIFDKVNASDAFTLGDFSGSLSLSTNTIKSLNGLLKDYSVQEEVEGFIAAIQSNSTNIIRFIWGDMVYTGRFNEITAEYTMFNTKGYPVRAKVYLRLTLVDTALKMDYMGSFQESFEKVFSKGNVSWSSISDIISAT